MKRLPQKTTELFYRLSTAPETKREIGRVRDFINQHDISIIDKKLRVGLAHEVPPGMEPGKGVIAHVGHIGNGRYLVAKNPAGFVNVDPTVVVEFTDNSRGYSHNFFDIESYFDERSVKPPSLVVSGNNPKAHYKPWVVVIEPSRFQMLFEADAVNNQEMNEFREREPAEGRIYEFREFIKGNARQYMGCLEDSVLGLEEKERRTTPWRYSQRPNIVMMSGYTCSLKSEISARLAEQLGMIRLETKQFGNIATEQDKSERYKRIVAALREYAQEGRNIIVDGTFGKREYRTAVYKAAEELDLGDVVVLECSCPDISEVQRRIAARSKKIQHDSICLQELATGSYDGFSRDVYRGAFPSGIIGNTSAYEVTEVLLGSEFACKVADALADIFQSESAYFVKERIKAMQQFAESIDERLLVLNQEMPLQEAVRRFHETGSKISCIDATEIRGKDTIGYYGRPNSGTDGDYNLVDFNVMGPKAIKQYIFSKWSRLIGLDGKPINAVCIYFTGSPFQKAYGNENPT